MKTKIVSLLFVVLGTAVVGCEDEIMTAPPTDNAPVAKATATASASSEGGPEVREFTPEDFVESEESRDPFRDFTHLYNLKAPEARVALQRPVKASEFALDELKLVGILTRGRASVLLTDPKGFGWILHTGDFIGRAEMVSVGGTDGSEVPINWKVDLIRADRVVFIREDTTRPEIPPTTRVMPLYPAGDPDERG
jgi:type IV pilus assembly protein PilP